MQWSGLVALGLVLGPAVAWSAPDCGNVAKLEDGWTVAAPQEQALDPELICAIGPRLAELKEANAHGVVIARLVGAALDRGLLKSIDTLNTPICAPSIRTVSGSATS